MHMTPYPPTPPPLCPDYHLPLAGFRQDPVTKMWWLRILDPSYADPKDESERGPFATKAELREALVALVNDRTTT